MSRRVVHRPRLRKSGTHAGYQAGEQVTAYALGRGVRPTATPGMGAGPGPVSCQPGPSFIARNPEARA
jgi:hypothetical protein